MKFVPIHKRGMIMPKPVASFGISSFLFLCKINSKRKDEDFKNSCGVCPQKSQSVGCFKEVAMFEGKEIDFKKTGNT